MTTTIPGRIPADRRTPADPSDSVVIVGAGQAGVTAAGALREGGWSGPIELVGAEDTAPYQRPPLSKGYLRGTESDAELLLRIPATLERDRITYRPGDPATGIDRREHLVTLASGDTVRYDQLVLATGSTARQLPGKPLVGVHVLRTWAECDALRHDLSAARHVVVIGGGFLGLEVAAAASSSSTVTVLERSGQLLRRCVSAPVADRLATVHVEHGVRISYRTGVDRLMAHDGIVAGVVTSAGTRLAADVVVVAIGAVPNTQLARRAGIAVDDGIVVDAALRTNDENIWAIGDCARYPSAHAGRSVRLQSVQNAVDQARFVAATLLGQQDSGYAAVPWFWSHQYDQNLQIAGVSDPGDAVILLDRSTAERLTALRIRDGLLTAVETLNAPADHVKARRLLAERPRADDGTARHLPARIMMDSAGTNPRFAHLPGRPGKIIAVHLSYSSRAAQRGRRPEHPSYFFKPSSSVACSGGTVERPAGTELLAFEGEIALVIGVTARRVDVADAWRCVGWVTAANDLGLYDLRAADRGSNVRSKGGDGFTPLGPLLVDAGDLDPAALRVRTWVNGTVVQHDTTADLIFPLPQLVADLSQHLTLEPGDVILTGTPAGSSVIGPGDVVEVEVDAPTAPGSPSSGRLVTTVTQGSVPFDAELGSMPAVDDHQRAEAWGSPEAAGLPEATGMPEATGLPEAAGLDPVLRAKLEAAPTAGLSAQLRLRGLNNVTIDGVAPLRPGSKIVGLARTLRFVPNREDLFAAHGGGYNAQKRAFDAVRPGEVIVIEARGERGSGTLGDVLAIRAHTRGAAGIVTDGGVRDADAVAAVGIAVFAAGRHPAVLGRRHIPWDVDVTIGCGGTTVQPGDVIVADADGVVVIPSALAAEVADAALAQEEQDAWVAAQIAAGQPLKDLFPMNAQWRARYEQTRRPITSDALQPKELP